MNLLIRAGSEYTLQIGVFQRRPLKHLSVGLQTDLAAIVFGDDDGGRTWSCACTVSATYAVVGIGGPYAVFDVVVGCGKFTRVLNAHKNGLSVSGFSDARHFGAFRANQEAAQA